jgi:hypothetical protein
MQQMLRQTMETEKEIPSARQIRFMLTNRQYAKLKYHAEMAGKTLAEQASAILVQWLEQQTESKE